MENENCTDIYRALYPNGNRYTCYKQDICAARLDLLVSIDLAGQVENTDICIQYPE